MCVYIYDIFYISISLNLFFCGSQLSREESPNLLPGDRNLAVTFWIWARNDSRGVFFIIHSDSFSCILLLSVYHFIPPLTSQILSDSVSSRRVLFGTLIWLELGYSGSLTLTSYLQTGVNMEERIKKAKWLQYHIISREETTEMDEMRRRNQKSKWPFCRIHTFFQPQTWTQLLRTSGSSSSRASLRFYIGRLLFLFGSHLCK